MLLGEIAGIGACALAAAVVTVLSAPFWLRIGKGAWRGFARRAEHAQRVLDETNEEDN